MLKQGSTYKLPIQILDGEDKPIGVTGISKIEFAFGDYDNPTLTKIYPDTVSYDEERQAYIIPLTQEETFKLSTGTIKYEARILWADGTVKGTDTTLVNISDTISSEVLDND